MLFAHCAILLRSTLSLRLWLFAAPRQADAQTPTILHGVDSASRSNICEDGPLLREGFG